MITGTDEEAALIAGTLMSRTFSAVTLLTVRYHLGSETVLSANAIIAYLSRC